jgi:hypothetical protein
MLDFGSEELEERSNGKGKLAEASEKARVHAGLSSQ